MNQSPGDWVVCPKMPQLVLLDKTDHCEHHEKADWVQCSCGYWFIYEHTLGETVPSCPGCEKKYYSPPEILFMGKGFYVNELG